MIALLKSAYRNYVPERLRTIIKRLRIARRAYFQEEREFFRQCLLELYLSIGKSRAIVRTAVGTRILVDLRDLGVGWPIFVKEEYEAAESRFICRALRAGDVFVDVGANIGYFATYASTLVGSAGKVIAFEPDPEHCNTINRNIRLNRSRNILLRNAALGAENGSASLFRSKTNLGDHRLTDAEEARDSVPVKVLRFDQAFAEMGLNRADFVKIDVQGYEPYVIAGMGSSFDRLGVRVILMEIWPLGIRRAGGNPKALLEELLAHGFDLYELKSDGQEVPAQYDDLLNRAEELNRHDPQAFINVVLWKTSVYTPPKSVS